MMVTSCTCLALAFFAWVLLRLINACFWLPGYLSKQRDAEMKTEEEEIQKMLDEVQNTQSSEESVEVTDGETAGEENKKTI